MRINCIAIDDEPLALEVIASYVGKIESVNLMGSYTKPLEGLDFLRSNPVDLVLLDINMPDLNGIELAKLVNSDSQVVFTTAYSEFATEGFDLAATDYLLKPIRFERFLKMIERVKDNLSPLHFQQDIFVKDGVKWHKIEIDSLLYLQANDNYVAFQEKNRKILSRMTLSEAKNIINSENFIQVHRSFIVNFSKIEKFEKHQIVLDGFTIPVSKKYQEQLFNKIAKTNQ